MAAAFRASPRPCLTLTYSARGRTRCAAVQRWLVARTWARIDELLDVVAIYGEDQSLAAREVAIQGSRPDAGPFAIEFSDASPDSSNASWAAWRMRSRLCWASARWVACLGGISSHQRLNKGDLSGTVELESGELSIY